MEFIHRNSDRWSSVSDEVLERSYGEHGEYSLDQLKTDLWNEGVILKARDQEEDLEEAYDRLEAYAEEYGFVTGEQVEETLDEYFEDLSQ